MSQFSSHDRTLPASPRRRRQARLEGHVWQSAELSGALTLGGIGLLLAWQGGELVTACGNWIRQSLGTSPVLRADQIAESISSRHLMALGGSAAALLIGLWLLAVIVRLLQVGPLFVPQRVQPRTDRISPRSGWLRLVSPAAWLRGPLWGLKLIVIGGILWWTITGETGTLLRLTMLPPHALAAALGGIIMTFVWRLCGGLLLVAALDAVWQRHAHERQLRMTAEEVRAERRDASRAGVHASACRRPDSC